MTNQNILENFLENIVKELEISESLFEKAEERYKSVGKWIMREESAIKKYSPKIYLQGSFKLGTVIKPVTEEDNYDVDSVCEFRALKKENISQNQLNEFMGKEIKSYATANNMIEEPKDGKRCWTLNYHEAARFHMDILSALPNKESYELLLKNAGLESQYKDTSIAITDKTSEDYDIISDKWEISNPNGYYEWFKGKMEKQYNQNKEFLAKAFNKKIEEIPDYQIKTPLQKSIQILKRHRDIFFENNQENKISSIIITTLSAKCYNGEEKILSSLKNIIENIESKIDYREGKYCILNPANPLENFADKWETNSDLRKSFYLWISKVKEDFQDFLNGNIHIFAKEDIFLDSYGKKLGTKVVKEAFNKLPKELRTGEVVAGSIVLTSVKPLKPWGDVY